jgi:hypothetical protein
MLCSMYYSGDQIKEDGLSKEGAASRVVMKEYY